MLQYKVSLRPVGLKENEQPLVSNLDQNRKLSSDTERGSEGSIYPVRTPVLKAFVLDIKARHPEYGRTRIRKEIPEEVPSSEKTIGRILNGFGIQNPPKRMGGPVKLTLTVPEEIPFSREPVSLTGPENAKIIVPVLYRDSLGSKLEGKVSEDTIKAIEQYTLTLLDNTPLYLAPETIPVEIRDVLYGGQQIRPLKIREALAEIGDKYRELIPLILPDKPPAAIALDEKVVEKWQKQEIREVPTDNPSLGLHYVSRRGKVLPSVSTDVAAAIDDEGTAVPIYFQPTPAPHLDKEKIADLGEKTSGAPVKTKDTVDNPSPGGQQPCKPRDRARSRRSRRSRRRKRKKPASKKPKKARKSKGKRAKYVILLLEVIMSLVGQIPIRMDNGYGQKAVVKWLNEKRWSFIVHGRSNLVIARPVKARMKKHGLRYYKRQIFDKTYGGRITVVGYCKRKNIYIYLTNEEGTAREIMNRYRLRWRIENLFKWCPCLSLLTGKDPAIHAGQQYVIYSFMSRLVHQFHASLPTIERLLSQPCCTVIRDNQLTIIFPRLSKRYYNLLENFVKSLSSHWHLLLEQLPL